jgi:hypothetical protein
VSRVPPTTSERGRNTSGQEAFGRKLSETPVVELPAASAADVTSTATGAGATAASEADKAGTSVPPTTRGEGGDHGIAGPQQAPHPQGIIDEGTEALNDEDRCLYAGTPWEAEVVTDHRDLETFREAARTIRTMLLVRTLAEFLRFLFRVFECHEVYRSVLFVVQFLAERAQARTGLLREAVNTHAEAAAPMRQSCRLRLRPHVRSSASRRSWRSKRRRRWPT